MNSKSAAPSESSVPREVPALGSDRAKRKTVEFAGAGIALGAAWGVLAAQPLFSYLLALPGDDWPDAVCEWVMLAWRGLGPPPGRVFVMVAVYLLVFGLPVAFTALVLPRIPLARRLLDLPAAGIGALVGLLPAVLLPFVWSNRGISGGIVALAAVALAFAGWTALAGPLVAAALRVSARRPGRTLIASAVLLLAAVGWGALGTSISGDTSKAERKVRRVMLIGLDGASWANLEHGLADNSLPHLRALREQGASGTLQATKPVLSPIIWTTVVTGVSAEEHGIRDFALDGVPYTSNSRRAYAIWEVAARQGLKSAIHYWWASWPAEETDGLVVTDRLLDLELGNRVSPESERDRIDELASKSRGRAQSVAELVELSADAAFAARHEKKLQVLNQILERDEIATALGESAVQGDYDFVATYLRALDAVGHKFWRWHFQQRHPTLAGWIYGSPDRDQEWLGTVHDRVDEVVDAQVGRLVDAAGPDINVVIVSDHGMTTSVPVGRDPASEPETGGHHHSGIVLLYGPDIIPGGTIRGATVYDVFPTLLYLLDLPVPHGLPGRILSEALSPMLRRDRALRYAGPLGARDAGDPTPIASDEDESYLEQLRALGYVVD